VPLCVFDNITGAAPGYRVATNILTSERRESLIYGMDPDLPLADGLRIWKEKVKQASGIAPRFVHDGPVLELGEQGDDVDLSTVPFLRWHEGDGGGYLSATAVTMRDLDTGYLNVGSYRFMYIDEQTMVVHIGSGHNGDLIRQQYWEQGKACPITVSLGNDPAVFIAAGANLRYGAAEYDYAGWLRGEPVELIDGPVTGVPMPAQAEVVLEAELLPPEQGEVSEGPFGEASGYYGGGAHDAPRVAIKAIWHRPNAIVMGSPPMPGAVRSRLGSRAVQVWNELDALGIPGITAVNYGYGLCIIAVKQAHPGHAMRAAHGAMGGTAGYHARVTVVVDDDINVYDADEVLWAIATRCDPETSVDIARRIWSYRIDPSLNPEKRARGDLTGSTMIIDATRPFYWKDRFPKVTGFDLATKAAVRDKWRAQLAE
jgi:4-hydroxy-3-polyprenylbenzoate decarboxylase